MEARNLLCLTIHSEIYLLVRKPVGQIQKSGYLVYKGSKAAQDDFGSGSTTFHLCLVTMLHSAKIKQLGDFNMDAASLENVSSYQVKKLFFFSLNSWMDFDFIRQLFSIA